MQASEQLTRGEAPPAARGPRRWLWALATAAAAAGLMLCYLRVAGTVRVNSDPAGLVLQARDMLHGNLLLHGWWDTDVSFATTELPEYMAVTALAGVRPEVVHICSALTYTLLVLLAAFTARGRVAGAPGAARALLAAAVMLAPQPTRLTPILLGGPDHVGTALPLLLLLLLLDRAPGPGLRRWYLPAALGVCAAVTALLAWVIVGDPLAEVVGVVPLALAGLLRAARITAVRVVRAIRRPSDAGPGAAEPDTAWRAVAYHGLLAAAAGAAVPVAARLNALVQQHAGYQLGPARYGRVPLAVMVKDAPMIGQSFLALFGADYQGVTGTGNVAFALVHLAGVAVVIAGVAFAAWRLLVPARGARAGDLVADFLVLAVLANVAAYFAFVRPTDIYSAHEIGPVASFGAALAGRVLGGPLLALRLPGVRRAGTALLAAGVAGSLVLLGIATAARPAAPQNVSLASWLVRHHLRSGLASYWEAASVTVETGGQVSLVAIGVHGWDRKLAPDRWESDVLLASLFTHSADFVVAGPDRIVPPALEVRQFGPPARTYHFEAYTIMVWNKNLLGQLNPY